MPICNVASGSSFGTGLGTRIADIASDTPQNWGSPQVHKSMTIETARRASLEFVCVFGQDAHAPGRSGMILPGVRTAGLTGGGARHGRGTAPEAETGLDFAGEKSAS